MTTPLIEVKSLKKCFEQSTVLHNIDLTINHGEFLTLLGPSGCGKTTLLRMLAGFETPTSGKILLDSKDITNVPPEKRQTNMVFQSYALFPHMTIFQNIAFGLECKNHSKSQIKTEVNDILKLVGLSDFGSRKPSQLSGGQQQRVAIARAVVNKPKVLLLDEPLSALDKKLREMMQIELKKIQRQLGITFIFVTHDQEEALSMSDRIVVMEKGYIQQIGTPRDIYEEPKNLFVANFIGGANLFPSEILDIIDGKLKLSIAGTTFLLKPKREFQKGQKVRVVVRPEDLKVWHPRETTSWTDQEKQRLLTAKISEVIYKGSTVDLQIVLDHDQKTISATEFFDEDDQKLEYALQEFVYVELKEGWEVILPDD